MTELLAFLRGSGTDHRGRRLDEILGYDDDRLEYTHDYIQWVFPLREASGVNPRAPVINDALVAEFAADEALRVRLRASLDRMLSFYGLERRDGRIDKGPNWLRRKGNWFTQGTHNDLRITRILKCLCALGLRDEAGHLLACLLALRSSEPDCGIGDTAFRYWQDAVAAGSTGPQESRSMI
ncbi:MAG TPA: opioid growth factor receptor-related protein [Burkholderiaceae bacterium]|nr:opioid growth factor receptor-related protein [Burkholderiaceae bacterium]